MKILNFYLTEQAPTTQPLTISSNVNLRPASSSTPYDLAFEQPKSRLPSVDENYQPEAKNGSEIDSRFVHYKLLRIFYLTTNHFKYFYFPLQAKRTRS